MKAINLILNRYRLAGAAFWQARSEQERKILGLGGALLLLALLYSTLIDPALSGRTRLNKELPILRQEAATIDGLALTANELKKSAPVPVPPMTRDSLTAALKARGLTPQSLNMTGEYAKLQFNEVPFSGLMTWLDAVRHESRIGVQDATIVAKPTAGLVDATLTLHQSGGGAK
ncbi:MAG: type II secretion system protein GspM [Pseudomonadota bacterium]